MNPRDSKNTWLTPWACVLGVGASVAAALAQVAPVSAQHIDVLPRLMIAADEPPEVEPAPEPPPAEPAEPAPEPQPEGPTEPLAQPEWDAEPDHPAALEHQAHAVESAPSTTPSPAPAGASRAAAADVPGFQPTMVELGVFGALLYHRLTYNDDLYGFMSPYSLTSAKEFGGYLAIYPRVGPVVVYTRKFMTRISKGAFPIKLRGSAPGELSIGFDCATDDRSGPRWDSLANAKSHNSLQALAKYISDNCDRSLEESG